MGRRWYRISIAFIWRYTKILVIRVSSSTQSHLWTESEQHSWRKNRKEKDKDWSIYERRLQWYFQVKKTPDKPSTNIKRPHYWYFAVANCGKKLNLRYEIEMTNPGGHWKRQLSFDEQGKKIMWNFPWLSIRSYWTLPCLFHSLHYWFLGSHERKLDPSPNGTIPSCKFLRNFYNFSSNFLILF